MVARLILCLLLVSGCATTVLVAASVTATWGRPVPDEAWDKVRLYRRTISGTTTNYTLIAEVAGTATNVTTTCPAGTVTFVARSVVGALESVDSNAVTAELRPLPPQNVEVR